MRRRGGWGPHAGLEDARGVGEDRECEATRTAPIPLGLSSEGIRFRISLLVLQNALKRSCSSARKGLAIISGPSR